VSRARRAVRTNPSVVRPVRTLRIVLDTAWLTRWAGRMTAPGAATLGTEAELLEALRRGDEAAFAALVRRLHPSMVRVARGYVSSRAVAEEVAQDTWLAVVKQLDRFEGRSSLSTWVFRILVNQAKSRGIRDRRTTPFSSLVTADPDEPAVSADSFLGEGHRWAGHWAQPVLQWQVPLGPEEAVVARELGEVVRAAVDALPPAQRAVVALRDGQALSSEEVCELLEISAGNQRVLLHRGRSRVRAAVDEYLSGQRSLA
jgi:RNA polymerase sigma-70 factor (ECF subfamily)